MADDDVEQIGGIAVTIGASHAQLASDLAEANRMLDAWARQPRTVQLNANVTVPAAQPVRQPAARPPDVSFGPGAATRAQAQQGQPALMRAIAEAATKAGLSLNELTGEWEDASQAAARSKASFEGARQAASQPIALSVIADVSGTESVQADMASVRQAASQPVTLAVTAGEAKEAVAQVMTAVAELRSLVGEPMALRVVATQAEEAAAAVLTAIRAVQTQAQEPITLQVAETPTIEPIAAEVALDTGPAKTAAEGLLASLREVRTEASRPAAIDIAVGNAQNALAELRTSLTAVRTETQRPIVPTIEAPDQIEPQQVEVSTAEASSRLASVGEAFAELRDLVSQPLPVNVVTAEARVAVEAVLATVGEVRESASRPTELNILVTRAEQALGQVRSVLGEIRSQAQAPVDVPAPRVPTVAAEPVALQVDTDTALAAVGALQAAVRETQAEAARPSIIEIAISDAQNALAALQSSAATMRAEVSRPIPVSIEAPESVEPQSLTVDTSEANAALAAVRETLTALRASLSQPVTVSAATGQAREGLDALLARMVEIREVAGSPVELNLVAAQAQRSLAQVEAALGEVRAEAQAPVEVPAPTLPTVDAEPVTFRADTEAARAEIAALATTAREARDLVGQPVSVAIAVAEAQAALAALATSMRDLRAQIEAPIPVTVQAATVPQPEPVSVPVTAQTAGAEQTVEELRREASQPVVVTGDVADLQSSLAAVLVTLREIKAEARDLASVPTAPAGGGRPPRRPAAATAEPEEEPEEVQYPRIEYVDRIERQRRQARESTGASPIEVDRSEAALWRQRMREEAQTSRERASAARADIRANSNNEAAASRARLELLTREAEQEATERGLNAPESGTFAPQFTPERRAAFAAEQEARATAARSIRTRTAEERAEQDRLIRAQAAQANATTEAEQVLRTSTSRLRRTSTTGASTASVRGLQDEDFERRAEARRITEQARQATAARTFRTGGSGFGGLFLGVGRERIEATTDLAEAERRLVASQRNLREVERDYPRDANAQAKAREEVAAATNAHAAALQRVERLSTPGAALRNLAAIGVAGAAFGAGLRVVDLAVTAASQALGNFIDIQAGFGLTNTRITTALAQQTRELNGNADAAIAAAGARAGLSAQSLEYLSAEIRLTTQVRAGAQAQQEASELFRAAFGEGNAPTGLIGGYGGVLGTSLLGQQLGGGRGFSETVQQDIAAFTQPRGGLDILGNFNRGLSYVTNPDVRGAIDRVAADSGQRTPLQELANFVAPSLGPLSGLARVFAEAPPQAVVGPPEPFQPTQLSDEGQAYINNLNDAAQRGAEALGDVEAASYRVATSQEEIDQATRAAAAAGDAYGVTLAQQQGVVLAFGDAVVGAGQDAAEAGAAWKRALEQASVGAGIPDPASLGRAASAQERQRQIEAAASIDAIRARQEYELPSIINAIGRQTAYATQVQQPAQITLQALAAPAVPVGTGIAPRDRRSIADDLEEARELQDDLNEGYAEGQRIIEETYRPAIVQNFGQAAATAFDTALSNVVTIGQKIAGIQADISNEQAAYQVAQYNFQLHIANRTLRDIAGLTGQSFGVEASRLGLLQRENLELSRQSQQLQFQLTQRQINFQTAVAGFQAPGVTPEERQANIKAAQIEAEFAQKQLDIQRKMFGNQVRIVDIQNLRQGADLVRQIALLQEGRQVTIDTQAAEQKLLRLNKLQQRNVNEVSSYLSAVDNLASTAFGHIQQLEAAAGEAISGIAVKVLRQFNIAITGMYASINSFTSQPYGGPAYSGDIAPGTKHARGAVMTVGQPTRIGENGLMGEAGDETLLILARPRSAAPTGGGTTLIVNFNGPIGVRSESDITAIAQKVMEYVGRDGAIRGFRSVG